MRTETHAKRGDRAANAAQAGTTDSRARTPFWVSATVAALLSGGLMLACYWPVELHLVAWFALVPWLVVLPRLGPGRTWLLGTLLGLVFYRFGLNWGFYLNGPLAGSFIAVLAVWMGFSFRVARLLMQRFGSGAMLWAVPLTFVGQEVLRCEAFPRLRFPFLAFGYSQTGNLWIAQIASLGGVYLLTGLLAASNAAVAYGLIHRRLKAWTPAAVMGLAILILGWASQPADHLVKPVVPVSCVQAETFRHSEYIEWTRAALQAPHRPAIVVLPEHAITDFADEHHPAIRALADLAREHGAYVCVGAHIRPAPGAECLYDNVGLLIGPDGRILGQQAKCVPLPFFIDGNLARSQTPFVTPLGTLGIFVCFDGLFTDVPRRLVRKGAELLLVPVMDVENWPAQERWQHARMAPMRCIELRRCAIRAASSGVSQIIDPTGRVAAQRTREDGAGVLHGTVILNSRQTLFTRGGYLFAPLVATVFLMAVAGLTVAEWAGRCARIPSRKGPPESLTH